MKFQNGSVYPFSKANSLLGESKISQYIFQYLNSLKAKTVLLEKDYIDKDYIMDYSYFYSRSFKDIDRKTVRIHFFPSISPKKNSFSYLKILMELFLRVLREYVHPILGLQ